MRTASQSRRMAMVIMTALTLSVLLVACTLPSRTPASGPGSTGSRTPTSTPTRSSNPTASPPGPRVILDENFDTGRLNSAVWNTCHWWDNEGCTISSNDELEWYRPEQVKVADGVLNLIAEPEEITGTDGKTYDFRSGMVTTGPRRDDEDAKLAFTYGSVEARLRVAAGRGLWSAMWLLPADTESRPEIDILEVIGQEPEELIMHLHPRDREAASPSKRYRMPGPSLAEGWHTVRLDWAPGRLTFFADGVRVWEVSGSQVPDEPMYLVLNLAVGGAYPGSPDESTRFPATFAIDYVRVTAPDS